MRNQYIAIIIILCFSINSCSIGKLKRLRTDDQEIEIIFLQMNDVYEIAPLAGGSQGGLARVAFIRNQLLKENPNVITVLSGDFLNPSLIGTMKIDGQRIMGRHMVEVLNEVGLDMATFGNHEFDIGEQPLQMRMNESKFIWLSSNVLRNTGDTAIPFTQEIYGKPESVPTYSVIHAVDEDGTLIRIGMLAVTLPMSGIPFLKTNDFILSAKEAFNAVNPQVDFVIAITHLDYKDDIALSRAIPGLRLIMGGHDHQNMAQKIGKSLITKADANAESIYIHRLKYNQASKKLIIDSDLLKMDASIKEDPVIEGLVNKWQTMAEQSFREQGFELYEIIAHVEEPYDGRESSLNSQPTNLGDLVTKAMGSATPKADCVLFNNGSIRLDDVLRDNITQYDILRALPYGGGIVEVEMDGRLLYRILSAGIENTGSGGYLQMQNVDLETGINSYHVNKRRVADGQLFRVTMPAFLLSGKETNMEFLTRDHPDIKAVFEPDPEDQKDLRNDIRKLVIDFMKNGGR